VHCWGPKAESRGGVLRKGQWSPSPPALGAWGSAVSSRQRGSGWSPDRKCILGQWIIIDFIIIIIWQNCSCCAIDSAYSYTFLRSVICRLLSVVCHTVSLYTWVVQWHIVWSLTHRGRKGDLEVEPAAKAHNCKLLLPSGEYVRAIPSFARLVWFLLLLSRLLSFVELCCLKRWPPALIRESLSCCCSLRRSRWRWIFASTICAVHNSLSTKPTDDYWY